MPPRHGKSQLCSQYFPAWYLGTHPEHRVILASYEASFAASWGRKSRDVLTEWGPQLYGVTVRQDSSAADSWNIERHRGGMDKALDGGMDTAGAGGPITGKGANLLIIDDPVKNWEEAQSKTFREKAWDWYTSTARTRLAPNGRVLLIMTRWNDDDLAGRLLKEAAQGGERWEVLSLPAIAEEEDGLGRLPGEALWPEQFGLESLAETRKTLGSQKWNSLYQQRPSPENGSVFRREWFKRYAELPQLQHTVLAVDAAFKTGVANDYSVIACWGKSATGYYLINVWRDRVEYPELKAAIVDQFNRFKPNTVLIEDAASGQSAIQDLQRSTSLPVVAVKAKGSKLSRAESISPLFESGKCFLPHDAVYADEFIEEHIAFPNAAHDDMVDTTSHALQRLSSRGETGSMPSIWDLEAPIFSRNIWDADLLPEASIWDD